MDTSEVEKTHTQLLSNIKKHLKRGDQKEAAITMVSKKLYLLLLMLLMMQVGLMMNLKIQRVLLEVELMGD